MASGKTSIQQHLIIYQWSLALTLYHTILTFKDPKEEGFGKHWEKRENAGN